MPNNEASLNIPIPMVLGEKGAFIKEEIVLSREIAGLGG